MKVPFIYREAFAVWRVFLSLIVFQILGGFIGFLLHHSTDTFMNIWSGCAFASSIGFVVGLYWHYKDPPRRTAEHRFIMGFFAFGSLAMLLITLFAPLGRGHI